MLLYMFLFRSYILHFLNIYFCVFSRRVRRFAAVTTLSKGKYSITYSKHGRYMFSCTAKDDHNLKGRSVVVTVLVKTRKFYVIMYSLLD